MLADLLVHFIIASVVVGSAGIVFFMWLNTREAREDNRAYESNFTPDGSMDHWIYTGPDDPADADPVEALKRFAVPPAGEEASETTAPSGKRR